MRWGGPNHYSHSQVKSFQLWTERGYLQLLSIIIIHNLLVSFPSLVYSESGSTYSLLLIENWSNSSQNWLRWSLDWAEQNSLNGFLLWSLFKSYDVMNLTRVDPILVQRLYLDQTLINRNETWYASSTHDLRVHAKVENSATYGSRDIQKFTFWLITFEQSIRIIRS